MNSSIISLCLTLGVDWVTSDISLINHHMNSAFERSYVPVTTYPPLPLPPLCQLIGWEINFTAVIIFYREQEALGLQRELG